MHVQHLRHRNPQGWQRFNRVAMAAIFAECLLLWFAPAEVWAANSAAELVVVQTVRAQVLQSYAATRTYAGTVVAGRSSELGFKFSGTLANVAVDIGATVIKGDILAALDTASRRATVAQARAGVDVAQANITAVAAETELARQTEQRFANLRQSGHVSEQEYDEQRLMLQAKQAQQQVAKASLAQARAIQRAAEVDLQEARIRAPYTGIVQARYADEGTQISPGQPVLRLVESSNKEAHVGLPEALATTLETGVEHTLLWSDQRLSATLAAILPEVDSNSRTLTAIYQIKQQPEHVVPIGAVVELALASEVASSGYWVPLTALTESERGLWGVYVVNNDQILERRLVEIIHTDNERAFVRGTLQSDDRVVATGIQRLVPGQRVVNAAPVSAG